LLLLLLLLAGKKGKGLLLLTLTIGVFFENVRSFPDILYYSSKIIINKEYKIKKIVESY